MQLEVKYADHPEVSDVVDLQVIITNPCLSGFTVNNNNVPVDQVYTIGVGIVFYPVDTTFTTDPVVCH